MSTYELDDDVVRRWLKGSETAARDEIDKALANQLPLPAPTNVGAVVRTEKGLYVRWAWKGRTFSPWIAVGNHEQPYRTSEIGRITEILSPGVEV